MPPAALPGGQILKIWTNGFGYIQRYSLLFIKHLFATYVRWVFAQQMWLAFENNMERYAAKLLFQWRPVRNGISRKRRVCEERIVTFTAQSPKEALVKAKNYGKEEEFQEDEDSNNCIVCFEFVGVLELKDISLSFSEGEVWYEITEMVSPMERKSKLIPLESELDVLSINTPRGKKRLRYK